MTNNPRKVVGLEGYGLEIVEEVPLPVAPNPHNLRYLKTKAEKLGHRLSHVFTTEDLTAEGKARLQEE
jgi:3,4-dihydroxy 2-butanone 4-phosphate synthase/GTP cyclohydrolase II